MPEKLTPEALELKRRGRRRLIGAVTIALLMVVLLPMIFDSEPPGAGRREIEVTVPAKEGQTPLPPPVSAPAIEKSPQGNADASGQTKSAPIANDAAPPKTVGKPDPVQKAAQPQPAKAESKPEPAVKIPAPGPTKTTPAAMKGFAVQLDAFADQDNVKQLKAKMAAAKIAVYTEQLNTDSGPLTRVRAGPYKTREQAERALKVVKKAGFNGKVVPLESRTP